MGEPGSEKSGSPVFEFIEERERTRGSEPSQYPEEEKEIRFP